LPMLSLHYGTVATAATVTRGSKPEKNDGRGHGTGGRGKIFSINSARHIWPIF
jgi:hypothetical protein